MATVRLAEWMREAIVEQLLTNAFAKKEKELDADFIKLGDDVYHDVYTPLCLDRMNSLPAGFFAERNYVKVSFSGSIEHLNLSHRRKHADKHISAVAKIYEKSHKLHKKFDVLIERRNNLPAPQINKINTLLNLEKN